MGWHNLWKLGVHPDEAIDVIHDMNVDEIRMFQRTFGLPPDGIVGPMTESMWRKRVFTHAYHCWPLVERYCPRLDLAFPELDLDALLGDGVT